MRLLFLNHNHRHLGTYERALHIAEVLVKRGHEATLLTISHISRWKIAWSSENGVRVGEMPNLGQNKIAEGYGLLDNLLRCLHAISNSYDIIHMVDHKPNATFAGFVGRWKGAKVIADWADWWGGPGGINDVPKRRFASIGIFEEWWEIKSKVLADGVVTISTVLKQRAVDVGCRQERILHLPNGCATSLIRSLPVSEARRHLGVPLDRKIVGFLGMGQGDLEITMKALQQLPDVWLMVVGPKNSRVWKQAQEFGIQDRLWQTDFVDDPELSWYLACADLMCLPLTERAANYGRLPGKFMYYLAAGRPTVVSPVGDVTQLVKSYNAGLLADEATFGEAINTLLNDCTMRDMLGRNARRAAETDLNWEFVVDRLEKFYERILDSK